jgi:hypothetical protein
MHQSRVAGKLEFDRDPDNLVPTVLEQPNLADIGHLVPPMLTYATTHARSVPFASRDNMESRPSASVGNHLMPECNGTAEHPWPAPHQPPLARAIHPCGSPYRSKNTSARSSMLSRGNTFGGVVGSSNAVCGMKRARPSFAESKHFSSSTSSVRIAGA